MILSTKVDRVDIHASIISPVVSECNHQFDPGIGRRVDNLVEGFHIDGRLAVCPALEDNFGTPSTFTTVLW